MNVFRSNRSSKGVECYAKEYKYQSHFNVPVFGRRNLFINSVTIVIDNWLIDEFMVRDLANKVMLSLWFQVLAYKV